MSYDQYNAFDKIQDAVSDALDTGATEADVREQVEAAIEAWKADNK